MQPPTSSPANAVTLGYAIICIVICMCFLLFPTLLVLDTAEIFCIANIPPTLRGLPLWEVVLAEQWGALEMCGRYGYWHGGGAAEAAGDPVFGLGQK